MEEQILNNRYQIIAELGQGGMGIVYRAHDKALNREVAVKLLTGASLSPERKARLLHEARTAASLNHPNIVAIHDVGDADDSPFIVMELVDGHSLHSHRSLAISEVVEISRQVCIALEYAHSHGVVHRDLKPENVILAQDGTAKLTDFGLARSITSRLSNDGLLVGTTYYLAPELARGQEFDGRVDLYALGVMLYELTTGELPFRAEDPLAVISQHLYAPVVPPRAKNSNIPLTLDALIVQLLAKNPADRPPSAAATLAALDRFEQDGLDQDLEGELSLLDRIVRGRFIGRERDLQEAWQYWETSTAGEGSVLLVTGEPGIGKTRFVEELAVRVELSGGLVLSGQCYEGGGSPYEPFSQVIRSLAEDIADLHLTAATMAGLVSIVPELSGEIPSALPADPALNDQRRSLYESVTQLFVALTSRHQVMLFIDDAHWGDSGSLALLLHIARRMKKQRLLIVTTYREMELDRSKPLNEILLELNRERLTRRIKLTRLSRERTAELLESLFAEETTGDLLDGIYRETEGNPFFVEEVVKSLVDDGKLWFENGRWQRPEFEELNIPQSVHMTIEARVNRLPSDAQATLQMASIYGRQFQYEPLRETSSLTEDSLIGGLESAERAQLIAEVRLAGNGNTGGPLTYTFAHALIPASLYESISRVRRQQMHREAGLALERLYPDRLEDLAPALGRHFAQAGENEKAVEYLLKAGDAARRLHVFQEAIDAYEQALELIQLSGSSQQAARIYMNLGLLYHQIFDYPRSRQAYKEGLLLWQKIGTEEITEALSPAPHPLRMVWEGTATLDPNLVFDNASASLVTQLFTGLLELSPEFEILPNIAINWDVLEGGKKYIFRLRDDQVWSDGTPLTAFDFEYSWKRVLSPVTESTAAKWLYDVKGAQPFHENKVSDPDSVGVRALDAVRLQVELEEPTGYFLYLMTFPTSYPIPRHIVERDGAQWTDPQKIVTNGSFQIEHWEKDIQLTLTRNPHFNLSSSGNLDKVVLHRIENLPQKFTMYENGDLDIVWDFQVAEGDRARRRFPGDLISFPGFGTQSISFDISHPPFNDPQVRRAFAHALDRDYLVNVILRGFGIPADGGFIPPGIPGHSDEIGLNFDPELARELLSTAGYPGGEGFPEIEAVAGIAHDTTRYLTSQWSEVLGVDVSWKALDWTEYLRSLHVSLPPLFWMGWSADYPDPDNFLRVGAVDYFELDWDARYKELVENAKRITEPEARMNMYRQADQILISAAVLVPIFYGSSHLFVKPWVTKFPFSSMTGVYFKDIVIEPHD